MEMRRDAEQDPAAVIRLLGDYREHLTASQSTCSFKWRATRGRARRPHGHHAVFRPHTRPISASIQAGMTPRSRRAIASQRRGKLPSERECPTPGSVDDSGDDRRSTTVAIGGATVRRAGPPRPRWPPAGAPSHALRRCRGLEPDAIALAVLTACYRQVIDAYRDGVARTSHVQGAPVSGEILPFTIDEPKPITHWPRSRRVGPLPAWQFRARRPCSISCIRWSKGTVSWGGRTWSVSSRWVARPPELTRRSALCD